MVAKKKVKYKKNETTIYATARVVIPRCVGIEQCCAESCAQVAIDENHAGRQLKSSPTPPDPTDKSKGFTANPVSCSGLSSSPINRNLLFYAERTLCLPKANFAFLDTRPTRRTPDNELIYIEHIKHDHPLSSSLSPVREHVINHTLSTRINAVFRECTIHIPDH
jgi:hypothetical protein